MGGAGLMMSPVVLLDKLSTRLRRHPHSSRVWVPVCHIRLRPRRIYRNREQGNHRRSPTLSSVRHIGWRGLKKGHENHIRNQTEQILIVHRICPPDKPFTCNRRVVVSDVFGHSTGRYPHAKQVVALESLPAGAPNGGSRCLFPPRVAHFLIGR